MDSFRHVIDNHTTTVAARLRRSLGKADAFDFVSAYFSIYGYDLLADELDRLGSVRFLYGDPSSVDELDPGAKEPKSFTPTEKGLEPNHSLQQKYLAERCADWVRKKSVSIRSVSQSNFLHGKMYLAGADGEPVDAVVGSPNFTRSGLGGSDRPNLEINLAVSDAEILAELQAWFDRLWNDKTRTEDVKGKVLDALKRVGSNHAPELIYFKTLLELFRDEMERRQAEEEGLVSTGFYDSQVWQALYGFQRDGARAAISKLRQHNGCILADSVGLGKTYTALAVIKRFEQQNRSVLVLCPRKLSDNWSLYRASNGHIQNPFPKDRFGYALLAHTDLSRDSGTSGGVNLASFNWGAYDLVVIDESHNFRNSGGQRYEKLLNKVIATGATTKVLMLSATPVNTSLIDLRNQIYLMTERREDSFRQSLGVGNVGRVMGDAQRQFSKWESESGKGRRDKGKLLNELGADFLRLLGGVSIARSRRHIEQSYSEEMERIGSFPTHAAPVNEYPPTDLKRELSYKQLAGSIGKFRLAVYQPSEYLKEPEKGRQLEMAGGSSNFTQEQREHQLVGMIRTNFLKRLESSPRSLKLTLERTIGKIDSLIEEIERRQHGLNSGASLQEGYVAPEDDEDDEDFFVNRGRDPYRLSELDLPRWLDDLRRDKVTLSSVLKRVSRVTPERDGKLKAIKSAVRKKAANPTMRTDGKLNRKLLVFTTFKDTALYLYNNLAGLADELGVNMAMVAGDETHTTAGANTFQAILTNFAPVARKRAEAEADEPDIDLLIATDCISEGQNLQDCDTVLNYDIHWNPVRLIQRFGRIDRIGSPNQAVHMVNYWPTRDMDAYLRLESRVQARMALADVAATGSDDPFTVEQAEVGAQLELAFRDQQLLRLKEEILDMDELDDAPVMSDFTLDHFISQLLRYLQRNRDELEALPNGVYAVTDDKDAQPGVIFLLRQRNAGVASASRGVASPVHPHYLVYVRNDGTIRYGCAQAHQVLRAFEEAAAGKTEPLNALCDRFDSSTDRGKDMSHYYGLLKRAAEQIAGAHGRQQSAGLGIHGTPGFILAPESEAPSGLEDFELLTWLVIIKK